mmetsp:Transcript_9411/g.18823  ORF Transcript_9411/g.18823 Transcript_9411/m.18823 type:complete len:586 (+) Transcript_9411:57-1814(+)
MSSFMSLDPVASCSINLLPPSSSHLRSSTDSVFTILNKTITSCGKSTLQDWISKPLYDIQNITKRHDIVHHFVNDQDLLSEVRQGLKAVNMHIIKAMGRVEKKGTLKDMHDIYTFTRGLITLHSTLSASPDDSPLSPFKNTLQTCNDQLDKLLALCEAVIDMDVAPREWRVNAGFNDDLTEMKGELTECREEIEEEHANAAELWSSETGGKTSDVRLDADKGGSYTFRIPDTNSEKKLRKISSFRVSSILKNGVHFETTALKRLSESYLSLKRDYEKAQTKIVADAMEILRTYLSVLQSGASAVGDLDSLQSLAHSASLNGYVRPSLTDTELGPTRIVNGRHPCVELTVPGFIPNDYDLTPGTSHFNIITGPNMGGKSTYIRGLGSLVAMAQAGSFIPCDSAVINIFDAVLCRVGAGDRQQEGISTFMAEMCEAADILKRATPRSLIVIDELGRGTSTWDGFGLAWAISEHVAASVRAPTLFATHFHELTRMKETVPGVKNMHVTAVKDGPDLVFLYKVTPGVCEESFGVQVAEIASVPRRVIEEAKRKAKELEGGGNVKRFKGMGREEVEGEGFLEKVREVMQC